MKGDKVRVGVIGTSWFADKMHIPNLKSHPRAEVAALCGRNRTRTEELAAKYAIRGVFCDYREMIQRAGLDAVIIVTPEDLHHVMTMDALDAGLPVLCEKPLARCVAHARAMQDKAEAKKLTNMTFFTYRWLPVYRYALRLIQEGYVGRCTQCSIRYLAEYGRDTGYSWRHDGARSNGVLAELGSHMIDLARLFVGEVAGVCGRVSSGLDRKNKNGAAMTPANDEAVALLEFAGGARGTIQLSALAHVGSRSRSSTSCCTETRGRSRFRSLPLGPWRFAVRASGTPR